MKKTLAFFAASAMLAASSPAALTDWKLQEKEEIRLEISESAAAVDIYVDGPFRCSDHGDKGIRFNHDPGYEVQYDFELNVPRTASIVLKTVMNGDVRVRKVEGGFEVHNVNGRIDLEGMGGAGDAKTVNGGIYLHAAK